MSVSETKLPRVCLLAAAETSPSVLYGLFDVLSTVGVSQQLIRQPSVIGRCCIIDRVRNA